jgi:hypothetical protein
MNKYFDVRDRFGEDLVPGITLGRIADFRIPEEDIKILRELGRKKAEIANHPSMEENIKLWKSTNDLKMVKPPIFIDEICWNEMNVDDELTLRTKHPFAQELEDYLRKEIYKWKHLPATMVVSPFIECPMVVYDSGFGIDEKVETVQTDETSTIVSRHFNILISNEDDIEKIKDPEIIYDQERTEQYYEVLKEIFDGIIDVKITGSRGLWFTPWDYLIRVTGIQETMMNLVLEPQFIDKVVERYVDASIVRMSKYRELGIWSSNNTNVRVGSGGYGYCSSLEEADKYPVNAPTKELWGCGNAQIFSEVSPEMHWEFSIKHELRWISEFGLSYYGCCEPLHNKMHVLERIPNLRKVSMSPWAKLDVAREICKDKYVMSCKPSPAVFAVDNWDPKEAKRQIWNILEQTKGCSIELVMKDISTVKYQPQKLWEWSRIAQETIDEYYG